MQPFHMYLKASLCCVDEVLCVFMWTFEKTLISTKGKQKESARERKGDSKKEREKKGVLYHPDLLMQTVCDLF